MTPEQLIADTNRLVSGRDVEDTVPWHDWAIEVNEPDDAWPPKAKGGRHRAPVPPLRMRAVDWLAARWMTLALLVTTNTCTAAVAVVAAKFEWRPLWAAGAILVFLAGLFLTWEANRPTRETWRVEKLIAADAPPADLVERTRELLASAVDDETGRYDAGWTRLSSAVWPRDDAEPLADRLARLGSSGFVKVGTRPTEEPMTSEERWWLKQPIGTEETP